MVTPRNTSLSLSVMFLILWCLNYLLTLKILPIFLTNYPRLVLFLKDLYLSPLMSHLSTPTSLTLMASSLPGSSSKNVLNRTHLQRQYATLSTLFYRTTILSLTDNFTYKNMVQLWVLEWRLHMQIFLWGPLKLKP